MGDTAGQLPDGFHFLCLAHGFFVMPYLCRALFYLLLQGLVQAPQLLLGALTFAAIAGDGMFQHLQVFQAITQLILLATVAQGHVGQADQGSRLERAFENGDVAAQLYQRAGFASAGIQRHQDGQVGPDRLVVQIIAQRGKVDAVQCFTCNDGQASALLECATQAVQVCTDERTETRLVEQRAGVGAIIAHEHCTFAAQLGSVHASPSFSERPRPPNLPVFVMVKGALAGSGGRRRVESKHPLKRWTAAVIRGSLSSRCAYSPC
ncbi:hypothetical protein D3C76_951130 [compost metagenome]